MYAALFSALINSCAPRYAPPPDLPSSVKQIRTPEETQQWLENVLTYNRDPILYGKPDFWAPCGLTYSLKQGDCEDYAICAAAILDHDIEQGYIVTVYNAEPKRAHAVFVFQLHGKWGMLSNDKSQYRPATFATLEDVVIDSLKEDYQEYSVYDYTGIDITDGDQNLKLKMSLVWEHRLR